jgi:hypothetical protein
MTIDRHAYTALRRTPSGQLVRVHVPASHFRVYRGHSTKASRGAHGPGALYPHTHAWISHPGKLGGPGYIHKSPAERHHLLNACVQKHGYRSCLGSIMVLERNRALAARYGRTLASDRHYLEGRFGARR